MALDVEPWGGVMRAAKIGWEEPEMLQIPVFRKEPPAPGFAWIRKNKIILP